jgi:DNA primase
MPLSWRELHEDLDPAAFDLRSVQPRLARRSTDPMAPLWPDRAS